MAVNKPVYFNEENEQDREILEHIKGVKFATYVKQLILADMNSKETDSNQTAGNEILAAINNIADILKAGVTLPKAESLAEINEKQDRINRISKFENMTL